MGSGWGPTQNGLSMVEVITLMGGVAILSRWCILGGYEVHKKEV